MSQTRRSVSDRLADAAGSALVGRSTERARLAALLAPDGPAVVFVHGPGGIGKTALVEATLAGLPVTSLSLDGRELEPTAPGALGALGNALGVPTPATAALAARRLQAAGVAVVVIDSFERLNLLDGWIRNELAGALPDGVTLVLVGRRAPNAAWRSAPGWRTLLGELELGPLAEPDIDALLAAHGVTPADAARISAFARGHPLAVLTAIQALARLPGLPLGSGAPADVVEELFAVLLDDLSEEERTVAEAASVLRRTTVPLLAAVLDVPDAEPAWQTLRGLPFTRTSAAGVELAGLAAPVLLEALELRDPDRVRLLRARAARAILESLTSAPQWSNTADLLHLVQNPLIRNAYVPPGMLQHPAEEARVEDREQVLAIARAFTGEESARLAERWWGARRNTFAVVRDTAGAVAAFSVVARVGDHGDRVADPLLDAVDEHQRRDPLTDGGSAVVFRWALGHRYGERPTPEVATLIIDLKRTYLQLRADLRRVYTVVADWPAAAPVLRVMGFDVVTEVPVGDRPFTLACLDFGPGGVDAWIARHVLAEQAAAVKRPAADEASAVFRLTAREQEVLALLADGMTNVQLAKALFISERTANRHVSNIFTKLGVHNRTQAARAAVAAGLAG